VLASVIVVVYNAPEDTMRCLSSLVRVDVKASFEVVIVDNGSDHALGLTLEAFAAANENVFLKTQHENLGFARGANAGAIDAVGDVIVLLNSDTVVTDGWLDGLVMVLEDPRVGAVTPVTNFIGHGPQLDLSAGAIGPNEANSYARTIRERTQVLRVPLHLAFFCVAIRRSDFVLLNGLNESFGLGNFEDDDFSLRLITLGYELAIATNVFVYHRGGATFSSNEIDHWAWLGANADRFLSRAAALAVDGRVGPPRRRRDKALVTVVMRTKDRPDELRLALRSLANQTDRRFEVVVVSTEGADVSQTVQEQLGDLTRWRMVQASRPLGRSAALNAGVDAATTPLIAYLDDDDIVLPFHMATLLDGWERSGRDAGTLVYSHYCLAFMTAKRDGRVIVAARKRLPFWSFSTSDLLVANRPAIHTLLHSRQAWEEVGGFDPELSILEDWDFLIRTTATRSMTGVRQETCEYRIYLGFENVTLDRSRVLEQIERLYERHPVHDREILAGRRAHLREWRDQIERLGEISEAYERGAIDDAHLAGRLASTMFGLDLSS